MLGWQPFVESGESLEEEVKRSGPGLPGLQNFYFSGVWATTGGLIRAATAGRHVMQFICKDDNKVFSAYVDPKAVAPTHIVLREKTPFNRLSKNITPPITPLSSRENSVASRETEPA